MSESPVTIGVTTADYLSIVLDEFFQDRKELVGTPHQIHSAFRRSMDEVGTTQVFEGLDFGPEGAPTFSHSLAAAISNLQSIGAIERANPKLTVYRRNAEGRLSEFSQDARRLLGDDAIEELQRIAAHLKSELAPEATQGPVSD